MFCRPILAICALVFTACSFATFGFGTWPKGATCTLTQKVTNGFSTSATYSPVTLTGADSQHFQILEDNLAGRTLAPGQSATLKVRFSFSKVGWNQAQLNISGSRNGQSFGYAEQTVADCLPESVLDYGSRSEIESKTIPYTWDNTNTEPVVFRQFVITGGQAPAFQIVKDECSNTTLPPGQKKVWAIKAIPTFAGDNLATLETPLSLTNSLSTWDYVIRYTLKTTKTLLSTWTVSNGPIDTWVNAAPFQWGFGDPVVLDPVTFSGADATAFRFNPDPFGKSYAANQPIVGTLQFMANRLGVHSAIMKTRWVIGDWAEEVADRIYATGVPHVVGLNVTINGQPAPSETPPSVYRLSNSTGYATPRKLQIFRVDISVPDQGGKDVVAWLTYEAGSGGHIHNSNPVRPYGYIGSAVQTSLLQYAFDGPGIVKNFCGGAFNNAVPLASDPINHPAEYFHRYSIDQRLISDNIPTNSYENGVKVRLDLAGNGSIYYVAPEIAGIERIVVSTMGAVSLRRQGTHAFVLKYPNLRKVSSSDIAFVASSDPGHFLPDGTQGNYFATADGVRAIESLAAGYLADSGSKLPLNDVSLVWGGMFDDARNRFRYPVHYGHRDGVEFDISTPVSNRKIERILREHNWWVISPSLWSSEVTHFHLRLLAKLQWRKGPSVQQYVQNGYPKFNAWNPLDRSRIVRVKFTNRGVDRATVSSLAISATGGAVATWVSGMPSFALNSRSQSGEYPILVRNIPAGGCTLSISGTATDNSGSRSIETFVEGASGVTQSNGILILVSPP